MGKFDINGVGGSTPVFGTNGSTKADKAEKTFDFGFNSSSDMEVGLDTVQFSATKPAFKSSDLDAMWAMAGITKPESIKPLENTMAFAAEGAEYGVEYSEEDMNLARFMFENLKA